MKLTDTVDKAARLYAEGGSLADVSATLNPLWTDVYRVEERDGVESLAYDFIGITRALLYAICDEKPRHEVEDLFASLRALLDGLEG